MNGMQFLLRRIGNFHPQFLFVIACCVFTASSQQQNSGFDASIANYFPNLIDSRWDSSQTDSTSLFYPGPVTGFVVIDVSNVADVSFYCDQPLGCTLIQTASEPCGSLSGWFRCNYGYNATLLDTSVNNIYYSPDYIWTNSGFVSLSKTPISYPLFFPQIAWNTRVIDIGNPNFNISICQSFICLFEGLTLNRDSAFLSQFPATSSGNKRFIESNTTCVANYISQLVSCPNGTYFGISGALQPINVTGTSFSLVTYFAICDSFNCYSNAGIPNTIVQPVTSSLPVSTTITMAILLPISFLLMCAFFVVLYKVCCESWMKM